jgi:uncharacterized protein (DUF1501 family)
MIQSGLFGLGVSAAMPSFLQQISLAESARLADGGSESNPDRILVVLELSGGNDGLNTIIPHGDDAYYKARPVLGIRKNQSLVIDDHYAMHSSCEGLKRLYDDGKMAIVHGCGYPDPNLSHFTAMEWWHTAVPHGNDPLGWLGRFADAYDQEVRENYIVNIAGKQSRAVQCENHSPVVFKDPKKFGRIGSDAQQKVFAEFGKIHPTSNSSQEFVRRVSRTATAGAVDVRNACSEYRTIVDYGSDNEITLDLKRTAAMIGAKLPTRIYYLNQGGYDTHAAQAPGQQLLLIYLSDAVRGFFDDMKRLGRSADVSMMIFTEFGRRVGENASKGTDHGTATPMYVLGDAVKGGFHGKPVSLTELDNGNLKMTTDFRSVYGSMLGEWMGFGGVADVLKGDFPALKLFG